MVQEALVYFNKKNLEFAKVTIFEQLQQFFHSNKTFTVFKALNMSRSNGAQGLDYRANMEEQSEVYCFNF